MKTILVYIAIIISLNCFSQAITVDTNAYTVPELVNNVLINSPCVSASNITWKTGSNFNSDNGIGFFKNTNPNFPMKSGVILSTGNVNSAVGPNTSVLNEGNAAWTGDSSLENTLTQAGITMNSTNATILEFDFVPTSTYFSFDFLFASEEYGNFQCQFSDAFAFLLTNTSTGVTTNLAVVPNTNTPISVVTIRDFLYNSSCPSVNEQYFGSYNGGSAAAKAAINFNGQTKLLNASATLDVNTLYHIKLVIADRSDSNSDSAIFIASDSFNIGQDVLGQDLSLNNNNALCPGDIHILNSGLNSTDYFLSWTKDGVIIPGANGPSLTINQSGIYGLTYQKTLNGCLPITDEIKIEYLTKINVQNPIDLYRCDIGASLYTYDLSINDAKLKAGLDPLTQISYHISLSDANNNVNPLSVNYLCNGNQIIFARIKSPINPCCVVKSFKLLLAPAPKANKPKNMVVCQDKSTYSFNLNSQNTTILNGQSTTIYMVKYYKSLADATTDSNAINPSWSFNSGNTTVYARVQNISDSSCFSITDFSLIINPVPLVDVIKDVVTCENYILPTLTNGEYFTGPNGTGTNLSAGDVITKTQNIYIFNQPNGPAGCSAGSSFNVKILDPLQLSPQSGTYCESFTLPPLLDAVYFTETGGNGTQLNPGTVIKKSQKIYVYFKSIIPPFCVIDTDFDITIIQTIDVGKHDNVFDCNSYTLPSLANGNYYTEPDGGGIQLKAGDIITNTQTIYVYATTPEGCDSQDSFSVIIGLDIPTDVSQCQPYILPPLAVGNYYTGPKGTGQQIASGTKIDISQTIYIYIPTKDNSNCTDDIHFNVSIGQPIIDSLEDVEVCESYTLPNLTNGEYFTGPNGTGNKLNGGDNIYSTQKVYIYKQSSTTNCSNQIEFTVTVNQKPLINSRADIDICNYYILTKLEYGNYYTGPNGTGTLLNAGTKLTTSQKVYIFAKSNTSNCISENSFQITIFPIEADQPQNVTTCDNYTLPALKIGNYYTQPGGPMNISNKKMLSGDTITTTTTLYVYAESGERINCTDENSFSITINKTPVVANVSDVNSCDSYILPTLTVGNYFTAANGTGTMLKAGDIISKDQTIYVYAQTATVPNCFDEKNFKVVLFNVDELEDVTICDNYSLPALKIGNYYTNTNGTGTLLHSGDLINNTQKIYIFATNPLNPLCSDESNFTVTIVDVPIIFNVSNSLTTVCDEDGVNDGVTIFNLNQLNNTVLGDQTSPEFKVEYFSSQEDAINGKNAIISTDQKTVFVKLSNTLTTSCYDLRSINIIVNKLPEPKPVSGIICYDSKTKTLLNSYTIESGLSNSTYTFKWYNETGEIVGNNNNYEAILPGTYTVIATNINTGCSSQAIPVEVLPSQPAIISYTISEDFTNNQRVEINATGNGGDYEYQLDSGIYQDSPLFENVTSGIHTVTVRDKNGCGNSTTEALVVNYPKFFTPNADGYNDTWNIEDLKDLPNAIIHIYDRQGKFLTNIKPNGQGWDGSYGGTKLPSTDYWFAVNYTKNGVIKEFKSHFTLKR